MSKLSNDEVGSSADHRDSSSITQDIKQRLASNDLSDADRSQLHSKLIDSVNKEADDGLKELRQGIDGLGKSLEQLMSPNGASSAAGAVAGASLRSSI